MTNETQRQDVERESQTHDRLDNIYESFSDKDNGLIYLGMVLSHEKLLSPETARVVRQYYVDKGTGLARNALENLDHFNMLKYSDMVGSQELYLELLEGYGSIMGCLEKNLDKRIINTEVKKRAYSRMIRNFLGNVTGSLKYEKDQLPKLIDLALKSESPDDACSLILEYFESTYIEGRRFLPAEKSQNPRLDLAKQLASRGHIKALERVLEEIDLDSESAIEIAKNAQKHQSYSLAARLFEKSGCMNDTKSCYLSSGAEEDLRKAYEFALRSKDEGIWEDLLYLAERRGNNPKWAAIFATKARREYSIRGHLGVCLQNSEREKLSVHDLNLLLTVVPRPIFEDYRELFARRYEERGKLQKARSIRKNR
jgi:hypothetical protein